MPALNAILFDLGNTLLYFDGDWGTVLAEARYAAFAAFQAAGVQVPAEPFLHIFRETLENHYARRADDLLERTTLDLLTETVASLGYSSLPTHLLETAHRAFYAVTQTHWLPELDAVTTLRVLHQQGYRMGVLSNAADDWDVQTLVNKAQVRPYLDFVMTSAAFGQRKPAPAIFRAALSHWNLPPARVAMVGDTLDADILGANRMGLLSIWITRRVASPPPTPSNELTPALTISNLSELPQILSSWSVS
ncbi:MAG: HAD family hydrolase [Anaerolineales bacterium]|nr:HAD family hydrolase [Anaerolineales bacterium]